jgi:beta-lactamase superfamily II metal-dependent hydrolase
VADRVRLRAIQAAEGDCLLLEADVAGKSATILIDGGPRGVYRKDLAPVLDDVAARGRRLDRVVLSHVDADHVAGLIDLFAALRDGPAATRPVSVRTDGLWHNQFSQVLDTDGTVAVRLASVLQAVSAAGLAADVGKFALDGIAQGDQLVRLGVQIGCPMNADFEGESILVGAAAVAIGPIRLRVVGPTRTNLRSLRLEWEKWLEQQEEHVANGKPQLAAFLDKSVPNLSSIQLLVEVGGRRMLMTGDGRGDHLLAGLAEAGLLDAEGGIHVDLLKVPHHGSDRNVNRHFFERITADTYVVSADGKHGNPDLPTLLWLVDAAAGRRFHLVCTNQPPTIDQLLSVRPPAAHNYRLTVRPAAAHSVEVDLL